MKKIFSLLAAVLFAGSMMAAEVTVTKTVSELVTANSWEVSSGNDIGTLATSFKLDANVTVSTTGEPNCGSIWGTAPDNEWRLYQAKSGDLKIAANGTIKSVSFKFSTSKGGCLKDAGGNAVESEAVVTVNASDVTFTVGNTGTATNGQIRVTSFTVVYDGEGGGSGEGGEGGETGDAISLNDVVYCDAWFNMYDAVYGDLSTWEFVLYKGYQNNDWINPYVSLTVYAASESSIVGTYGFGAELQDAWADIDDETEVEAVSGGDLVVTHDSFHHYRFKFTFVADDGETYTIDKVVNTVAYDITNSDEENAPTIELDEDAEETAISNTEATVKAVKTIKNGHLIIERNGVNYNANGQIVR